MQITINLEMMNETTIISDYIKVELNEVGRKKNPKKLNAYDQYSTLKTKNTKEGRTIINGKLYPNSHRDYELRIWIDKDVKIEDEIMDKVYKSKVVIESTIGSEPLATDYLIEKEQEERLKEESELMYDDTADENLRYVGATPNNYIDIGDKDSENKPILWRIIGVMKNVYNVESEKTENLIKIIRNDKIGDYSWDTSASNVNGGYGVNEWSKSDVMKLLNPGNNENKLENSEGTEQSENVNNSLYWNSLNGKCYSGTSNKNTTCDFRSSGISVDARNKLAKIRWNMGTFATYNPSDWLAKATYKAERSNNDGKKQCIDNGGGEFCNDDVERTTTWDGYIGLMNPSDFGYAVGKSVRDTCLSKSMRNYNENGCSDADWLFHSELEWTMTPIPFSSLSYVAFDLDSSGYLLSTAARSAHAIRPVAYLKSSVTISDALGTLEDPFVAF